MIKNINKSSILARFHRAIERIKAAYNVLFHKEYVVFTTTTDYEAEKIERISCYIGEHNTVSFNVSCEHFLRACVNKDNKY